MASNNQRKTPKFNIFWMYGIMILFLVTFYYLNQDGGMAQEVKCRQRGEVYTRCGVSAGTPPDEAGDSGEEKQDREEIQPGQQDPPEGRMR